MCEFCALLVGISIRKTRGFGLLIVMPLMPSAGEDKIIRCMSFVVL
jgi:hypothetical protein